MTDKEIIKSLMEKTGQELAAEGMNYLQYFENDDDDYVIDFSFDKKGNLTKVEHV